MEILQSSYAPRGEGEDTLIFSCYVDLDQAFTVYTPPPPKSGIIPKSLKVSNPPKYSNSVS